MPRCWCTAGCDAPLAHIRDERRDLALGRAAQVGAPVHHTCGPRTRNERPSGPLVVSAPEAKLCDDCSIPLDIVVGEVIEETTSAPDEHE